MRGVAFSASQSLNNIHLGVGIPMIEGSDVSFADPPPEPLTESWKAEGNPSRLVLGGIALFPRGFGG
jgi:hypothetical protein